MGKFSRALDWAADHVGDVYFLALAVVAVGGLGLAAVFAVRGLL